MKKSLLIILVLICAATLFSQERSEDKIINGPWLQNLSENSVTFMWITKFPSVPGVLIGTDQDKMELFYNSTDGMINARDTLHKIRISKLKPGQKYFYRLYSRQFDIFEPYKITYSDTIISRIYSFTTLPHGIDNVNFVVFNDVHNNSTKMASYLRNINIKDQNIWFFNGDMVDFIQDKKQILTGFLDTAVCYFAKEKPFVYVRGNHEARGKYARQFKDFFDFKDNTFYNSFTLGPVHFIILDCGEDKPDDNQYYYQLANFDEYRNEQLGWLKREILTDDFKNASFRVVLCHMPIYKQEKMGHGMQFLADHFGPVLEEANIDLLISGHTHRGGVFDKENSSFNYPVLVNSNNTYLEVSADKNGIIVLIKDTSGKIVNEFKINKII